MNEVEQLRQAIAALESQRATLGDVIVDAAAGPMREKMAALSPEPHDEQRKLVTVLFADLAGWTALSERMDAEDVRAVQLAYFAAVTPPIIERGGSIEKYIGDAILAVFGIPLAREDDPERAIQAALAMQQAIASLQVRTLPNGQPTILQLRIGIHTGPVLATVGQHADDFVVTGDTVNVASRLQTAAPTGGVLISHDTWRHVQGLFDLELPPPLAVKGKTKLVQTYLVAAARPRPFRRQARGVAGIETRMIGRDAELLTLQNALEDVMSDSELRMVTVIGEAGVGKSRLLGEFERWVADIPATVWYFKGRASPDSERQPFGLLRTMLATRFAITENDPLSEVHRKLQTGLASLLPTEETFAKTGSHLPGGEGLVGVRVRSSHLIGHLVGYDFSDSPHVKLLLDDPQQLRVQALAALAAFFDGLTAQGPVLLLLEDLHWADDSSLDALNQVAQTLSATPLFVLAAARPDLYERRPHWGEGWTFHSRLDLRPLSKRASRQLVQDILQHADQVPDSLQDLIVNSADGNPFFVEELIKMLVDDGVIDTASNPWHIDVEKLRQAHIPATLTGVLQARLDRLPAEERTILQQAAVVGPVFWDLAVLACNGELDAADSEALGALRATLQNLRSRELVFQRETSTFDRALEHTFKHAILRDVTYETVLKRLRQVYHGLVADWLIAQTAERIGEFMGLIADHLEGAGRGDEAVSYLLRAGDQARLVHGHIEAIGRYERALAMLEAKGDYDRAARTCMRLGITHQNASDYASERLAFDRGFALWQRASEVLQDTPLPPAPHALRVDWLDPQTLDPTLCSDGVSAGVIGDLFSGLVESGPDFDLVPDVARSWQISEDRRTYVFHLRDDVRWSDGMPVTASDFVFAWRRRLDPAQPAKLAETLFDVKNARAYHQGDLAYADQIGVQALDDRTLVVELEEPTGYFLQLLALLRAYPVPQHAVERLGEGWTETENIVTNGPFFLKTRQPGRSMVLVRNPNYHGRFLGNVTQEEFSLVEGWRTTMAMYEANALDTWDPWADELSLPDLVGMRQRYPDEYFTTPVWSCQYLEINASKPPFDDPRVRRALVLAVDREALHEAVPYPHTIPATGGFVPRDLPGHSTGIGLPYDPVQAKRLLAEAGYPDGSGFPAVKALTFPNWVLEMRFLGQQWQVNLGIEVATTVLDLYSYHQEKLRSMPQLSISAYSPAYPDPDDSLRVALRPTRNEWQNDTFEGLISRAKQLIDQSERMQLYRQADRILIEEAAIMPLFYFRDHGFRKPWLSFPYRDRHAHTKDIIIQPH